MSRKPAPIRKPLVGNNTVPSPNNNEAELSLIDAYKQAIELAASNLDTRQIVIDLAKEYPHILIELHSKNKQVAWHRDVVDAVRTGRVVDAIKTVRDQETLSLRDAKVIVDHLRNHIESGDHHHVTFNSRGMVPPVAAQCADVYNQLCTVYDKLGYSKNA